MQVSGVGMSHFFKSSMARRLSTAMSSSKSSPSVSVCSKARASVLTGTRASTMLAPQRLSSQR